MDYLELWSFVSLKYCTVKYKGKRPKKTKSYFVRQSAINSLQQGQLLSVHKRFELFI